MIDLHSHILPGIDDGARTLAESIGIAEAAVRDGLSTLAAPPHVRDDYPTAVETMKRLLGELHETLASRAIELKVVGGAEIAITALGRLTENDLHRFALAGNPRYLLLEFPYFGWPLSLEVEIGRLDVLGITVVLAHPERNPEVQRDTARLAPAVSAGALVQLTAASVDGRLGSRARGTSFELIESGLAHLVASDAHSPDVRAIGLSKAVEAIGDPSLANWLVEEVPRAIVDDGPIPPRPPAHGKTRRRWGRR